MNQKILLSNFTHNDRKQYLRQLTRWAGTLYLPDGSCSSVMTVFLPEANILRHLVLKYLSNISSMVVTSSLPLLSLRAVLMR